jgi:hypothetical protein
MASLPDLEEASPSGYLFDIGFRGDAMVFEP